MMPSKSVPLRETAKVIRLKRLTDKQLLAKIQDLLRQMGDLAAYVKGVEGSTIEATLTKGSFQTPAAIREQVKALKGGSTAERRTRSTVLQDKCVPPPVRTAIGTALPDDGLKRAAEALTVLNAALTNGSTPAIKHFPQDWYC